MADVTLRQDEKRYVRFPVTASADPLDDPVTVAFPTIGSEPAEDDFVDGEWEPDQTWTAGTAVWARIQVGVGTDVVLDPGVYNIRARITDTSETVDLDVGTLRIRGDASLTGANLRAIREEIGATAPPADGDLDDLWAELGSSVPAVALAVLRPRLADARVAAASGGFTLSGVLGTTAPAAEVLRQLDTQIARLEGQLAAETGEPAPAGLATSSGLARRYDRPR